jgi:hypothetical protein
MRKIEYVFIHCTGGNQDATSKDLILAFKEKGWKNPGYHIVIDKKGASHVLLDIKEVANGVAGRNFNSIHIAWIGGLDGVDNRTEAQKKTLGAWINFCRNCGFKVLGHRDIWGNSPKYWQKTCPNFDVTKEYQ